MRKYVLHAAIPSEGIIDEVIVEATSKANAMHEAALLAYFLYQDNAHSYNSLLDKETFISTFDFPLSEAQANDLYLLEIQEKTDYYVTEYVDSIEL